MGQDGVEGLVGEFVLAEEAEGDGGLEAHGQVGVLGQVQHLLQAVQERRLVLVLDVEALPEDPARLVGGQSASA
jgi:hypothetical protein